VDRSGVGIIVIGVDTSGSIGQEELEQFAGEITAISDEAQPEAIHVVYCDAAVQSTQEFAPSEPIRLEPKGGGGTNFCPVFEWVANNGIAPACLIYLTDLCCHSYPEVPEYPVLWASWTERETSDVNQRQLQFGPNLVFSFSKRSLSYSRASLLHPNEARAFSL
jgi:predicted metal-dependent peptidase